MKRKIICFSFIYKKNKFFLNIFNIHPIYKSKFLLPNFYHHIFYIFHKNVNTKFLSKLYAKRPEVVTFRNMCIRRRIKLLLNKRIKKKN